MKSCASTPTASAERLQPIPINILVSIDVWSNFFPYGEQEIAYLKSRDKRLGEVIDKVGMVKRR